MASAWYTISMYGDDQPPDYRDLLPVSATTGDGALCLAGIPVGDLAKEFGTPLYVYDELSLRTAAHEALAAFGPLGARVSYAAKACALVGVLATFRDEGLNLDVVSAGEIAAALRAGFGPEQMHLHGNCKSDEDLATGLRLGLHAIVFDNLDELRRLEKIATRPTAIWLRIALPIVAETHPHLQTAGGTKFGVSPGVEVAVAATRARAHPLLELRGLHAHCGSQISDPALFSSVAQALVDRAERLAKRGMPVESISIGGGWAVPYVPGDPRLTPADVASALAPVAQAHPEFTYAVEPGRALVARAAIAIYRVGAVKFAGRRRIVAVDGGMGDNPRPALYDARYTALPVEDVSRNAARPADIVGRYCESGDVIARDVPLPDLEPGELLCVPVAGAYQLSMASAYNLIPPPPAILVNETGARTLLRRAGLDDLLARDAWPSASS